MITSCTRRGALICALVTGAHAAAAQPAAIPGAPATAAQFDLVLAGGRVMDPESGLDAVRHVGIMNGRIAAISTAPLQGRDVVNVAGLVVAPGFIDLHAHGQDDENFGYFARNGVTTALEMEAGAFPVARWYAEREGKMRINFGATVSHAGARIVTMHGPGATGGIISSPDPKGAWAYKVATDAEIQTIGQHLARGLDEGALGLGLGINYTPAAGRDEIYRVFQLAAQQRVPLYVHVRGAGEAEPTTSIDAFQEVIANAAATGASLHIVHIGSSGLRRVPLLLEMIEGARRRGLDITTEVYPYTADSTRLESAIFDPGWRERIGIDYGDLQWSATGERLTAETFESYRKQGGWVVIYMIPEDMVRYALAHPLVIIASDAVPLIQGRGHPRGPGTYARVLGYYVREQKVLPLMDALRKMTLLPAQRVEGVAPEMRNKGRLRVGADADITVFDPERVTDRATYEKAGQYSEGIPHVLVNGVFVVRDSRLVEGATPGRAIRRAAPR